MGSNHTIRYLDGRPELQIPARDVSIGTTPKGSTWRVNPVPACNCDKGFACTRSAAARNCKEEDEKCSTYSYRADPPPQPHGFDCSTGTQFPVPFPYGYGQQVWNLVPGPKTGLAADTWVIVDKVRAPTVPGDYVLRWRWDVEQNPQIWTHCALCFLSGLQFRSNGYLFVRCRHKCYIATVVMTSYSLSNGTQLVTLIYYAILLVAVKFETSPVVKHWNDNIVYVTCRCYYGNHLPRMHVWGYSNNPINTNTYRWS